MRKFHYLLLSIFFFITSYKILFEDKIDLGIYGMKIVNLEQKLIMSIPLILVGLILFFMFLKTRNKKEIEFSKCPKCKETFTYTHLKDGLCPKCNVKTIDMEEYFRK